MSKSSGLSKILNLKVLNYIQRRSSAKFKPGVPTTIDLFTEIYAHNPERRVNKLISIKILINRTGMQYSIYGKELTILV